MECKVFYHLARRERYLDLIETLWNVKLPCGLSKERRGRI